MASGKFVLYHYDPSLVAAVIFVGLFSLSATLHVWQLRSKAWYMIPFLIGCGFEAAGYAGRAISATQTPDWTTMPYVLQSLLLLLGPTLLAASIYMVLGRLIRLLDADNYSLIRPQWLTKLFVLGDVISFLAQSSGGGMLSQAKTKSDQNLGEKIIIGGLGIQIVFFQFFMLVTVIFHRRMSANPTPRSLSIGSVWKQYILVLYAASVAIMIRSVFRIAEYINGSEGVLQSTEVYIYIFDAALMFAVALLFNIYHPSKILANQNKRILVSDDGFESDSYAMMGREHLTPSPVPQSVPNPYINERYSNYNPAHQQGR
ncbi:RTA1 like protein-domain-containing protein [Dactylonectria estremocensis]|uniref:RTA1 like protein-domain-containing protein n=1 Tax=Dactylonectria estremocensis TaxID=1079267 RepID=A0A9P9ETP1_9HYPO|nr:RTA1 like protein-domain-containing protein [Dactylonectria estremocensis]